MAGLALANELSHFEAIFYESSPNSYDQVLFKKVRYGFSSGARLSLAEAELGGVIQQAT